LKDYRYVPILSALYSLYGKGVGYSVIVAPATTMDGSITLMILGRKEPSANSQKFTQLKTEESSLAWLREDDCQYLMIIAREMAIITNVLYSMSKIQEATEVQTNLMESVSHDLYLSIRE